MEKEILLDYIQRFVNITERELDLVYDKLVLKEYQKKEFILHEGKICRHYYFILNGLVRIFYTDRQGNEKITQFGIEHWWITNLESFIHQSPSYYNIQALEDTKVLCLSHDDLEELYEKVPKLERLFRKISEGTLIALQRRNGIYMQDDGQAKYRNIVEKIPDFVQRIPQYMLASYLEMTPEHLSYLRSKNK